MFSDDEEDEEIGEEFVDRLLSRINSAHRDMWMSKT